MNDRNPFEYDAAPNLEPEKLVTWYIEDYNYSRFIESTRNIIINGERGSGKSMALMYHSLKYRKTSSEVHKTKLSLQHVGIYIPCNTPLHAKEEYKLLGHIPRIQISEANLLNSILASAAREFADVISLFSSDERAILKREFGFALELSRDVVESYDEPFDLLKKEVRRRLIHQQRLLQTDEWDPRTTTDGFFNVVMPVLEAVRQCRRFQRSHFSLLVDDLQDLNDHQQRLVNSWIGYRDHSLFSVKAAVAGLRTYNMENTYGGVLLEGHDYVSIDLQRPVQSGQSEFGKFAQQVIERRLRNAGLKVRAAEYFPVSPTFTKRLGTAKARAEDDAEKRGMARGSKAFRDFVYKYGRAYYFRDRDAKANKPVYSGFETLTHLSTGVIRNLLQPCFWMVEQRMAEMKGVLPKVIPSDVQDNVIKFQSDRLWDFINSSLDARIADCSVEDARRISRLFARLGEYFRDRLLHHASEPRVLVFVVSETDHPSWPKTQRLLSIAERAQLIYIRTGTSKKGGGRETYYVPNRMLWPRYGLDVHGQHGRASLRARDLWAAAEHDSPIHVKDEVPVATPPDTPRLL